MSNIARCFPCEDCGGTGSVRVHSPEDYGVSFECELCEHCGGTGEDVPALQAAYRGAVEGNAKLRELLDRAKIDVRPRHLRTKIDEALASPPAGGQ